MAQYQRKPVIVQALQWDGTNSDAMTQFLISVTAPIDVRWSFAYDSDHTEFIIRNQMLDGVQTAGDLTVDTDSWVVCNENNVLAVYADVDFNELYEVAP